MKPAGEGRPDKVVIGEPVVENGDERLPLRVTLVYRCLTPSPSILHLFDSSSSSSPSDSLLLLLLLLLCCSALVLSCFLPAFRVSFARPGIRTTRNGVSIVNTLFSHVFSLHNAGFLFFFF